MSRAVHNTHMKLPMDVWLRARQQATVEHKNMTELVTEALEALLASRNNKKE